MENKVLDGCMAMTEKDEDEMRKLNHDCGWGFSVADCLELLGKHMYANITRIINLDSTEVTEAYRTMEKIEYRLEDANFHTFCGLLHDHNYDEAMSWIRKKYADDFEGRV